MDASSIIINNRTVPVDAARILAKKVLSKIEQSNPDMPIEERKKIAEVVLTLNRAKIVQCALDDIFISNLTENFKKWLPLLAPDAALIRQTMVAILKFSVWDMTNRLEHPDFGAYIRFLHTKFHMNYSDAYLFAENLEVHKYNEYLDRIIDEAVGKHTDTKRVVELTSELFCANLKLKNLEQSMSGTIADLNQKIQQLEQTNAELSDSEKKIQELATHNVRLMDELTAANDNSMKMATSNAELLAKVSELEAKVQCLETSNAIWKNEHKMQVVLNIEAVRLAKEQQEAHEEEHIKLSLYKKKYEQIVDVLCS